MLSVVIPCWSGTPTLIEMHVALCRSVIDDCDELIVSEDGPYSSAVAKECDRYLTHPQRLGHAQNLQYAIERTVHSYVAVLDSDIVIKKGSLRKMCNQNRFTEGKCLTPHDKKGFVIWCSVTDRMLYKKYPMPIDKEILDDWADSIPKELITQSEEVEYEHNTGIGFQEWLKVHRAAVDSGRQGPGFRI